MANRRGPLLAARCCAHTAIRASQQGSHTILTHLQHQAAFTDSQLASKRKTQDQADRQTESVAMQAPTLAAGCTAVPLNRTARRFQARNAQKLMARVQRAMPQATRRTHTFATAKQQVGSSVISFPRLCHGRAIVGAARCSTQQTCIRMHSDLWCIGLPETWWCDPRSAWRVFCIGVFFGTMHDALQLSGLQPHLVKPCRTCLQASTHHDTGMWRLSLAVPLQAALRWRIDFAICRESSFILSTLLQLMSLPARRASSSQSTLQPACPPLASPLCALH